MQSGPRSQGIYRRAASYYRPQARKLLLLLGLNAAGVGLALLAPGRWRPLLRVLPASPVGIVVSLAVLTLLIRLGQELVKLVQTMTQHCFNYGV